MNEAIAEADEGTHSNQWGMVDLPRVGPSRVELMGLGSTMDRRYNVMLKKHLANSQVYRFAKRQGMSSWRAAGDFITEVTIWSASLTRDERRFAESLGTGRLEDNEVRAAHAPDQVHAMGKSVKWIFNNYSIHRTLTMVSNMQKHKGIKAHLWIVFRIPMP
jgi:hypothetical protein